MRTDLPTGLDPKPGVPEVQQRVLRGPQRAHVPGSGGTDRGETRVRGRLQLHTHGHAGRGVVEAGRRRWTAGADTRRAGRPRGRGDDDSGGGGDFDCCGGCDAVFGGPPATMVEQKKKKI